MEGVLTEEDLKDVVRDTRSDLQTYSTYQQGGLTVQLLGGDFFFFRTGDTVGSFIVAVADGSRQRIDLSCLGGRSSIMRVSWGAREEYEHLLATAFTKKLKSRGLQFELANQEDSGTT